MSKKKIAIIGTRGIPNNYGGFEQLAEQLSRELVHRGHAVSVYSPHDHVYKAGSWNGVEIVHRYDPERRIGSAGQFIYDLNCILHARKRQFDVVLNLGYTSSSLWLTLLPRSTRLITNMDGLEWKRSKYSRPVQKFLRFAEKQAARLSDVLVADSRAIQLYLRTALKKESVFIAYGAPVFREPDEAILSKYGLSPFRYSMLIARMEPENNIMMILEGLTRSRSGEKFLVVGNTANKYGTYLKDRFESDRRIVFTGPEYDCVTIDNLRYHSRLYFHGHSVGGTNPSLLEAMGCAAAIAAHDNEFNRSVLGNDALFFRSSDEVAGILDGPGKGDPGAEAKIAANIQKIADEYSWKHIASEYERLILDR